jgi:hypothetical protein
MATDKKQAETNAAPQSATPTVATKTPDSLPVVPGAVDAVGTATSNKTPRANFIETAMSQAITDSFALGDVDPVSQKARMMRYREAALQGVPVPTLEAEKTSYEAAQTEANAKKA